MSNTNYNLKLQNHNILLQETAETINNLPSEDGNIERNNILEDNFLTGNFTHYYENNEVLHIPDYAFSNNSNDILGLQIIHFPFCQEIGKEAFYHGKIKKAFFPRCTYSGRLVFCNCYNLTNLSLGGSLVATLVNVDALENTPISDSSYEGSCGSIYVPASLCHDYKQATNWATYADRIVPITKKGEIWFHIYDFTDVGQEFYLAKEGMTWEEWVNSSYNVAGLYISNNKIHMTTIYAISGVSPGDVIIDKTFYDAETSGGSAD